MTSKKVKRIALYPNIIHNNKSLSQNPYLRKFSFLLKNDFIVHSWRTNIGIFSFLLDIYRYDVLILNWIEDLPHKRFGIIQSIVLILLQPILRSKKIVYVVHNKFSHANEFKILKYILMRYFLKKASLIITHSSDGIHFINNLVRYKKREICFVHHPTTNNGKGDNKENYTFDILIWGSIQKYKGIDYFLENIHKQNIQYKYKILIYGKTESKILYKRITSLLTPNILFINSFLSNEEKSDLISKSKIIFFPYFKESLLSSSLLMDAITYDNHILGPNVGAFKDLANRGLIDVYDNLEGIEYKIDELLSREKTLKVKQKRASFIDNHNWEKTVRYISQRIKVI